MHSLGLLFTLAVVALFSLGTFAIEIRCNLAVYNYRGGEVGGYCGFCGDSKPKEAAGIYCAAVLKGKSVKMYCPSLCWALEFGLGIIERMLFTVSKDCEFFEVFTKHRVYKFSASADLHRFWTKSRVHHRTALRALTFSYK